MPAPIDQKPSFAPGFTLACLVVVMLYTYLILVFGHINMRLGHHYSYIFFDYWQHLSRGDVYITPVVAGREGFWVGDQTTVYFLPLPALIRGLLSLINYGESALASAWLAMLCFILASVGIWYALWKQLMQSKFTLPAQCNWLGIIYVTVCTPFITLMLFQAVFWEAIEWAAASFLVACLSSIYLLQENTKNTKPLKYFLFAIACGVALFTRATFAFASCCLVFLTSLFLIYQNWNKTISFGKNIHNHIVLLKSLMLFSAFLAVLLGFNYLKWGSPFEFYPLSLYKAFTPADLVAFEAMGALKLGRIPTALAYYLLPAFDNFKDAMPFLQLGRHYFFTQSTQFNYQEPTLPLTLTIPLVILLFFMGLYFMGRSLLKKNTLFFFCLPACLCALIPVGFNLMLHARALRYAGDLMPALTLFSQLGLVGLLLWLLKHTTIFRAIHQWAAPLKFLLVVGIASISLSLMALASMSPILQNQFWQFELSEKQTLPMLANQAIGFQKTGPVKELSKMLGDGWASLEDWGIWSNGPNSTLTLDLPLGVSTRSQVILRVNALLTPKHPTQAAQVWVNGQFNQDVTITQATGAEIFINVPPIKESFVHRSIQTYLSAPLEARLKTRLNPQILHIELKYPPPMSPKQLGINPLDDRAISIGLVSVMIRQ